MRILDLFCGGDGAAMGYHLAGHDVTGVDLYPQPKYPFEFIQADALEYADKHSHQYDFIHASPPCQVHSCTRHLHNNEKGHVDLVPQTRETLQTIGKQYAIENVPGAPLINPITLCGTMFGLPLIRHRLFETSPTLWWAPATCCHMGDTAVSRGISSFANGATNISVAGHNFIVADAQIAMGIDWLGQKGLAQAIPPAYTFWLINQIDS